MALTVLSVGYALAPVGPDSAGGAEQVLSAIDRALVANGHRSIVVGYAGSAVAGELIETPAVAGRLDAAAAAAACAATREAVRRAIERRPIDLVHMHGLDFAESLPPTGVPVLVTLHLPLAWYPPGSLAPQRPRTWHHCVSQAQHRTAPPGLALLPPVENGVDLDRLAARHAKRGFAVALGRICPEKGFHHALDAAHTAGASLLLAGTVYRYPAHERYFADEVAPRLDGRRRFLGPVGFDRKRRLLSAARCLLAPSLAPETSSLVAMEALACGTPVIAFPAGALPEIVEHGKTGFLVDDACEMAAAIEAAGRLDPERCRAAARARFGHAAMFASYLDRYREILGERAAA